MDIADAVTTDYSSFDATTRVSKLVGAFDDRTHRVVVVTNDDELTGVVTQRQLLASRHDPDERIGNVMREDPPRVERTEDVRETARLMVESQLKLLPVFEGREFVGVVTARELVRLVLPNLDALEVSDVYTQDLVSIDADTSLGRVLNHFRDHRISRVPVVSAPSSSQQTGETPRGTTETSTAEQPTRSVDGLVSIYDLVGFVVRSMDKQQGGSPSGFDQHGGDGSREGYRTHGGWGERAGDLNRLLNLPASDVMTTPAATVDPDASLDDAVEEMLETEYASLIVTNADDDPVGIVTLTDVLRSLTWTAEEKLPIQIFGIDILTGMSREDVAGLVAEIDEKYAAMDVIEAYVILQEHQERLRGVPLVRATIRLFTNKGRFAGTGEGYGADVAIREARDNLERNVLDEKEYDQNQNRQRRTREDAEKLLGWWLEA